MTTPRENHIASGNHSVRYDPNANPGVGIATQRPVPVPHGHATTNRLQGNHGGRLELVIQDIPNVVGARASPNAHPNGGVQELSMHASSRINDGYINTSMVTPSMTNSNSIVFNESQPGHSSGVSSPHPQVAPATPHAPIRMINRPVKQATPGGSAPRRAPTKYRGKDPIKKLVQNDKLRALFAGRKLRERKKARDDRPDLRDSMGKIFK